MYVLQMRIASERDRVEPFVDAVKVKVHESSYLFLILEEIQI